MSPRPVKRRVEQVMSDRRWGYKYRNRPFPLIGAAVHPMSLPSCPRQAFSRGRLYGTKWDGDQFNAKAGGPDKDRVAS